MKTNYMKTTKELELFDSKKVLAGMTTKRNNPGCI
jgi:hypothetical protein